MEPPRSPAGVRDFFVALRVSQNSLIVELDQQAIREHMLPTLAERHFPDTGSDRYRVSILDPKSEPVLSRGLREGDRIAPDQADVTASFFGLRLDALRDTAVRWTTTAARRHSHERNEKRRGAARSRLAPGMTADRLSVMVEQRATTTAAPTRRHASVECRLESARAALGRFARCRGRHRRGGAICC